MRVTFPAGGKPTVGYLAIPKSGAGPGVLVFQEYWGLVPQIERVCDRLAVAGFTALAPDMYSGRATTDPDEAGRLMMAMQVPEVADDAGGALDYLLRHEACSSAKAGTMGFCVGGQLALFTACTFPDRIGACVDVYGIHPNIKPDLTKLQAPVLGIFAEKDTYVTAKEIAELESRLEQAGKDYEFKTYAGVDHAFMNEERIEKYDRAAAADAWGRAVEFLRRHLK